MANQVCLCVQEPRDIIEITALQMTMLYGALKRNARMLRCVAIWVGATSQNHPPAGSAQWLHVLLHYLTDYQLENLLRPKSQVHSASPWLSWLALQVVQ